MRSYLNYFINWSSWTKFKFIEPCLKAPCFYVEKIGVYLSRDTVTIKRTKICDFVLDTNCKET